MTNSLFYQGMQSYKTFPLVVNSTTIILIGGDISRENNHTILRYPGVTCVNILTNKWTPYPNMPNHVYTHSTTFLAAVSFDKSRKRYLIMLSIMNDLITWYFFNQCYLSFFAQSFFIWLCSCCTVSGSYCFNLFDKGVLQK